MIDWLTDILLAICFGVEEVAVLLISMVPLIELKGGIPVGVKLGLSLDASFWLAFLGSSFVCIPILLVMKPIFEWAKGKNKGIGRIFARVENVFRGKAKGLNGKIENNKDEAERRVIWLKCIGVFLFVAIPAPGTGVWTGSVVAVIIGLGFWWSVGSIVIGNLVAGGLIALLTRLLGSGIDVFLYILFAIVVVMLAVFIYKVFSQKEEVVDGEVS